MKKTIEENLFLAIYFNDLNKVKAIKNQYPEIYAQKHHFLIDKDTEFDLPNLTLFNHIIWFNNDWTDGILPFIQKMRKKTQQMIDFWKEELGEFNIDKKFKFNRYHDFFYCCNPQDPYHKEDFCLFPISDFVKKGYREIDIKLYNAIISFDFETVEKLLQQGANPNIDFSDEGDDTASNHIELENSFLVTTNIIPAFLSFEEEAYESIYKKQELFGYLLGLAAYEKMCQLLQLIASST